MSVLVLLLLLLLNSSLRTFKLSFARSMPCGRQHVAARDLHLPVTGSEEPCSTSKFTVKQQETVKFDTGSMCYIRKTCSG